jgi:putative transposase
MHLKNRGSLQIQSYQGFTDFSTVQNRCGSKKIWALKDAGRMIYVHSSLLCYLPGDDHMKQKYSDSEKQQIIDRYRGGESVAVLSFVTATPRSTIYSWIKRASDDEGKKRLPNKTYRTFENKVSRLEGTIEILQKSGCRTDDPLKAKLRAIEELYGQYSVHLLCDTLGVPRGTFYNYLTRNKRDNTWYAKRREKLKIKIQEVYDDSHQIFGAAKIAALLKNEGCHISVDMVRELMRDMGLTSIRQDAKDLYDKEALNTRTT